MAKKQQGTVGVQIVFHYERETKNTHRYREDGDRSQHVVGALYVSKRVFPNPPEQLRVTIEEA